MRGNDDENLSCGTTEKTFNWKIKGLKGEACAMHNIEGIRTNIFTFKIQGHMDSKWMMEIKPGTIVTEDGDWCPIKISIHRKNPGTINVQLCSFHTRLQTWKLRWLCLNINSKIHKFIGESSCDLFVGGGCNWWSILESRGEVTSCRVHLSFPCELERSYKGVTEF